MQNTVNYKICLRPVRFLMCITALVPFDLVVRWQLAPPCCTFICQLAYMCAAICLIFVCFLVRLSRISREIAELSGDILSNGVEFIGFTILALIHLILSLESTWSISSFHEIFLNFERICCQFQSGFNRRPRNQPQRCVRLYICAHFIFYVSFSIIIAFVARFEEYSPLYIAVTMFSEIALKLKMIEIQTLALLVIEIQQNLLGAADNVVSKLAKTRLEPHSHSCVSDIEKLQQLHADIWANVRLICEYVAWSFPSLLLKLFTDISLLAYWTYLRYENHHERYLDVFMGYNVCSIFSDIFETSLICYFGALSQKLDKRLALKLHSATSRNSSKTLTRSLRRLHLQLCHEPIYFTAGNFVDVNLKTLSQFLIASAVNVVILIQIRMSTKNELRQQTFKRLY